MKIFKALNQVMHVFDQLLIRRGHRINFANFAQVKKCLLCLVVSLRQQCFLAKQLWNGDTFERNMHSWDEQS